MPLEKAAGAILYHPQKGILMILRENRKGLPFPNHWTLPGGHGQWSESAVKIAKREIWEEICYKPRKLKLFDVDKFYNHKQYTFIGIIDKPLNKLVLCEGKKLSFIPFNKIDKTKIAFGLKKVIKLFIKKYISNKPKCRSN